MASSDTKETQNDSAVSSTNSGSSSEMKDFVAAMVEALKESRHQVKHESAGESKISPHAKLPKYYTPGQNFRSWLSQLNQYIELVRIPSSERKAFLVTLLDQQAYRAVELLRLPSDLNFQEFTAKLTEQFDSTKTRGDYKHLFRARKQKSTEGFESFSDSLLELAENAYPDASLEFRAEIARDQFLEGVSTSDEIREKLFMHQPETLDDAVKMTRQLESARRASSNVKPPPPKGTPQCYTLSANSSEFRELKELITKMNKRIDDLEKQVSCNFGTRASARGEM